MTHSGSRVVDPGQTRDSLRVEGSIRVERPMCSASDESRAFALACRSSRPANRCISVPARLGGDEWNSPAYVPETNRILMGEVKWCYSVTVQDDKQLRGMSMGAPWTGMHTSNPFNMFGDPHRIADNGWGEWVYAVDAHTGVWKWRAKFQLSRGRRYHTDCRRDRVLRRCGRQLLCARFRHG